MTFEESLVIMLEIGIIYLVVFFWTVLALKKDL